jgi:hypothetical protein
VPARSAARGDRVEETSVEDGDASIGPGHDPLGAKLPESARHDLPNGSDSVGKLLLRGGDYQLARLLLRCRKVEQVPRETCAHGAERNERQLLHGLGRARCAFACDGACERYRRLHCREQLRTADDPELCVRHGRHAHRRRRSEQVNESERVARSRVANRNLTPMVGLEEHAYESIDQQGHHRLIPNAECATGLLVDAVPWSEERSDLIPGKLGEAACGDDCADIGGEIRGPHPFRD